jgi:intracellular multiplication protein IcmL
MPIMSTRALLSWARQAAISANTYDFVNYLEAFKHTANYFTERGWQQFRASIEPNVRDVIARGLRVSAVAINAPVVTDQGVLGRRFSWRVVVPILVTYESASAKAQQRLLVNMLIERVSTREIPRGIAIVQFFTRSGPALPG